MAEQKKVLCGLNAIIDRAHWVYGIPKIVLEFIAVQFTKPHSEQCQISRTLSGVTQINKIYKSYNTVQTDMISGNMCFLWPNHVLNVFLRGI